MRSFEHNSSVQQAGLLGHWWLTECCWHFVSSWNWKLDTYMKPLYYAVVNKPQSQVIWCCVQSHPQIHTAHEFLFCGQTNPGLNYTEWASGEGAAQGYSVPLRTGTCYIRDILELFLQGYSALQESQMKMNFNSAVVPHLAIQRCHFQPCPYTLFSNAAPLVNLLDGDKCQNVPT